MPSYPQEIINESSMLISTQNLYRNPNNKMVLPASFQPGPYDVICARGKVAFDHVGNRRFRKLVKLHQANYANAVCKYQKSKIVSHIVNTIRDLSPEGGFVKLIKGVWHEVGDRAAKEKIGQTFRDLLHTKYTSSTKAKARARIQQRIDEYESEENARQQRRAQSSSSSRVGSSSCESSSYSGESSDDDSVEMGLYPSLVRGVDKNMPSPIIEIPTVHQHSDEKSSGQETQQQQLQQSKTEGRGTENLPERSSKMFDTCDIEPLSLDDDSIGNIDVLVTGDLGRRSSACFDEDMKVFAEVVMGIAV